MSNFMHKFKDAVTDRHDQDPVPPNEAPGEILFSCLTTDVAKYRGTNDSLHRSTQCLQTHQSLRKGFCTNPEQPIDE